MKMLRFGVAGLVLAGFLLGGAGCAPKTVLIRPPAAPSATMAEKATPPAAGRQGAEVSPAVVEKVVVAGPGIEHVAKRLALYESRLHRWDAVSAKLKEEGQPLPPGSEECRSELVGIYQDYGRLREHIGQGLAFGSHVEPDPWAVTGRDFAYEASGCDQQLTAKNEAVASAVPAEVPERSVVAVPQPAGPVTAPDVRQLVDTVQAAVAAGRYRDVLAAISGQGQIPAPVGLALGEAYGEALLHTDQVDAALAKLQEMLASPDAGFSPWQLRLAVADLLFATRHYKEAGAQYQALVTQLSGLDGIRDRVQGQLALLAGGGAHADEMEVYSSALRSYLTFDGRRVPGELKMWVARLEYAHPDSDYTRKARLLLDRAEKDARTWIGDRLLAVDGMVEARQYRKALARLEDLSQQELPKAMVDVVQKTMDDVVVAEAREKEELQKKTEQMLAARWQEGGHLLDSEKYDEAIAVFTSFFGTGYDVQAREKIGAAAAKAAAAVRGQAAAAFLKARQAVAPAQKREALLESQRLLKSIIAKYPFVELVDKVTANLAVIEQQLAALPPAAPTGAPAPPPATPVPGGDAASPGAAGPG